VTRDWRDDRIVELEAQVAERDRVIAQLMDRVARLTERVEKLEEQLRQSSQNSSKPPSSDPPWLLPKDKKKPTGRKPGGQPGHKKHERALLPPERVDETHDVWPERCEGCQHPVRFWRTAGGRRRGAAPGRGAA
jgi:transposase